LVVGLLIGAVLAALVVGVLAVLALRRLQRRHEGEIAAVDEAVHELRQERAEDKETNRRLRHQLAANTPDRLIETATAAELARDGAMSERNHAVEQLRLVQHDLDLANSRLADRESKLRKYREALKEIRMSLEAQGRARTIGAAESMIDTGELTAPALGGVHDGPPATPIRAAAPDPIDIEPEPEPVDLSAAD
jgi:chromosome segregation ATPase